MELCNKKVLFITSSLTDGGAEKVMSILSSQCAELGADVTLVALRDKKHVYKISDKVNFIQIKTKYKNSLIKVIERCIILRKVLKNCEAKTIISFLPINTLYVMISKIGLKRKLIISERANPNRSIFEPNISLKDRIGIFIFRKLRLYSFADWIVFQTPDAKSYYSKKMQEKSCIIVNPLNTSDLPYRYKGERSKIIVAAGRLSEEKNFSMLIQAFSEFHKVYNDYKLIIYGEGKLRSELENQIKENNLEHYISLPGFVDNLSNKINNASIYISTSNHEGISNSMIEALGMGIPTIATDCPVGGSRMFVNTDKTGILIPMNDHKSLLKAMIKIVSDSEYREKISLGAEKIREKVSGKDISLKWLDLVE